MSTEATDKKLERKQSGLAFSIAEKIHHSDKLARSALNAGSRFLNIKKMCGIPNAVVFHVWNIFIIADSLGHFILFNTKMLGGETPNKGVLSSYSIILMTMGIAAIYIYSFYAEDQRS